MTTASPAPAAIDTSGAFFLGLHGRFLRAAVDAHAAGVIALPDELAKSITVARALERAAAEAGIAEERAHMDSASAVRRTLARLTAEGPFDEPSKPIRDAAALEAARKDDHDRLSVASRMAQEAIEAQFLDACSGLGLQLLDALPRILSDARPLAPLVTSMAFDDPAAIARLGGEAAASFERLADLAVQHDAAKLAGLAIWEFVNIGIGNRPDGPARVATRHQLNLDASHRYSSGADPRTAVDGAAFIAAVAGPVGAGLVGPNEAMKNKGPQPGWSAGQRWFWDPSRWSPAHPVSRLALAALAVDDGPPKGRKR